jgi:integrator complex subunit 7
MRIRIQLAKILQIRIRNFACEKKTFLQVWSESHHYWLDGLALVSRAEELVCREEEEEAGATHQERLTGALTILHRGIATLTAATTPQHPLTFQIQFLRCRAAVLQVL